MRQWNVPSRYLRRSGSINGIKGEVFPGRWYMNKSTGQFRVYRKALVSLVVLLPVVGLVFLFGGCGEKAGKEKAVERKQVRLETSAGVIVVALDEESAPVTVANFFQYVAEGHYDGTIFHRVKRKFMIQGGGFTADMTPKKTREPIINEASNGLKNKRGTIAMARQNNPNSATAQFFINQVDNGYLDYVEGRNPGYAVFGAVVEGMDVVDAIAGVDTTTKESFENVPVEPVVIKSAKVVETQVLP